MNWKNPVLWLVLGISIGVSGMAYFAARDLDQSNTLLNESIQLNWKLKEMVKELKEQLKSIPSANFSIEIIPIPEKIY